MSLKYFGTDGIRGEVGGSLLTEDFVRRVGQGVGNFLRKHNQAKPITVVIGRDPRSSGEAFEQILSQSLCSQSIHVIQLGILPTPGVSMCLRDLHADFGVVITASHNPATDNGLKFFDNRGVKFSPHAEAEIERFIDAAELPKEKPADCSHRHDGAAFYVNVMRSLMHQGCLKGWKVVLDTANGATAATSPAVFRHFAAELTLLGAEPNGDNINEGVGSEHPDKLAAAVLKEKADIGIAHDGDGDRLLICDEKGRIVDGDQLLGILGLYGLRTGRLRKKTLVATVQSNLGLDRAIEAAGGRVIRTPVGDRNVLLEMLDGDYNFGGESSGHIIFRDYSVSGDGLLAAIQVLGMLLEARQPLSELVDTIELFPQVTRNLKVVEKIPLEDCPTLSTEITTLNQELEGKGRILVRYSGTEPKLRLLAEGESDALAQSTIKRLEAAARQDLKVC
ncbi:MAG: phosphoglucosamine mutase [Puniceicoccales bacterium]